MESTSYSRSNTSEGESKCLGEPMQPLRGLQRSAEPETSARYGSECEFERNSNNNALLSDAEHLSTAEPEDFFSRARLAGGAVPRRSPEAAGGRGAIVVRRLVFRRTHLAPLRMERE